MKLPITLISALLTLHCYAQNLSFKPCSDTLTSDGLNILELINTSNVNCDSIAVTASNGSVYRTGCTILLYPSFRSGRSVLVTVTANTTQATQILLNKEFHLRNSHQLIFKVGPGMSRMPAIVLKNEKRARIEVEYPSYGLHFEIKRFLTTILYRTSNTFIELENASATFSTDLLNAISQMRPNDSIIFRNITATDPNGKEVDVPQRQMTVY